MKNKTWIISDTHFNHDFMIRKGIRPTNYQELIINNWKEKVGPNDVVIHLGDVIFSRPSELGSILKNLPGYKILVKGNHDKNKDNWYKGQGFQEVHENYFLLYGPSLIMVELTHHPINTDSNINVSGHLHNYKDKKGHRRKEISKLNNKNRLYSCELEGYSVILLGDIISTKHQSHEYIMNYGINKKISKWMKNLRKNINTIGEYRLF